MNPVLYYTYRTLINGFCSISSFIFFLHFLKLKEKYNDKKFKLCAVFYFISTILQIPNNIDHLNSFAWVTLLYFIFQMIFVCKTFDGNTGHKLMLFFTDKLLDVMSIGAISALSGILTYIGVNIFSDYVTPTGYLSYKFIYFFSMNLLAMPIKIISALIIEKLLKLLKKVQNLSFILVPLSFVSIFSGYIFTYYEFMSTITFVAPLVILGCVFGIIGYILMFFNYNDIKQKTIFEQRLYFAQKNQEELFKSIDILAETQNAQRRINHDYKNQLNTISMLLKQKEYDKAEKLIDNIFETVHENSSTYCANTIINATVNYKAYIANAKHIKFNTDIIAPEEIPNISEMNLCSLFSNFIDNAIEANEQIPEDERYVNIKVRCNKMMLIIQSENPVKNNIEIPKGTLPKTTKQDKDNHGLGLSIINKIARESGGLSEFTCENNIAKLYIRIVLDSEHLHELATEDYTPA